MPETDESINETGIPEIAVDITEHDVPAFQSTLSTSNVITQPTDKTLSVENMPADAKAVGDALTEIRATEQDTIADVATNAANITALQQQAQGLVPKSDIETTLITAGKVADSKATGDAIQSAKQDVLALIDTTLTQTGGIAEAEATGLAINAAKTQAVTDARSGVVLSVDGITPDSTGALTLSSLLPTDTEINAMIDALAV